MISCTSAGLRYSHPAGGKVTVPPPLSGTVQDVVSSVVLQLSSVHGLLSSQFSAGPPTHTPPAHVSFVVQTLPSSHEVPSGAAGFEQVPSAGSHVPALWH